MQKSTIWTIAIVAILVVLGIILLSLPKQGAPEATIPGADEVLLPGEEEALTDEDRALEGSEALVPEGSLVSEQGEVLTPTGEPVSNEASPGSPQAPKQSRSLSEEEVPKDAVKLTVTASGFEPNEFTVKAGDIVTLSLVSGDRTHVFKFVDPGLQGVAIGVASNETRAITFNAPAKGDYTFYCDVPGHRGRGETGVMHVK